MTSLQQPGLQSTPSDTDFQTGKTIFLMSHMLGARQWYRKGGTLWEHRQVLWLLGQLLQQLQGEVPPVVLSQQGHQLAVPPSSLQGSLAGSQVD